jgi:hypothetical protein
LAVGVSEPAVSATVLQVEWGGPELAVSCANSSERGDARAETVADNPMDGQPITFAGRGRPRRAQSNTSLLIRAANGGQQPHTLTDVSPPASDGTLYVCALHPKRRGGSVVGLATGWLCSSGTA